MFTIALIAYFASRTPTDQEGGPLHFGNSFLSGLFGTYFGIKSSGDASQKRKNWPGRWPEQFPIPPPMEPPP